MQKLSFTQHDALPPPTDCLHKLPKRSFYGWADGQRWSASSHLCGGEGVPVVRQGEKTVQELCVMAVHLGYLAHHRPGESAVRAREIQVHLYLTSIIEIYVLLRVQR